MRKAVLLLVLLWGYGNLAGQTLAPSRFIADNWPQDEKRIWQFTLGDTLDLGRLEVGMSREGGGKLVFDHAIELKWSLQEDLPDLKSSGEITVDKDGFFDRAELDLLVNGQEIPFEVVYNNEKGRVIASWKTDVGHTERELNVGEPVFVFDQYQFHLLELALARQELTPGKEFDISFFMPSLLVETTFEFLVVGKTAVRYSVYADSVWQVNMLRPNSMSLFIDRNHNLVKVIERENKLIAELTRDTFQKTAEGKKTAKIDLLSSLHIRMPVYGLFLVIAIIGLIYPGWGGWSDKRTWLYFVIGALLYPVILYTQAPLQEWYGRRYIVPVIRDGGSLLVVSLLPAILTGFMQQTLKLIPLLFLRNLIKKQRVKIIILGAFLGGGFGFCEACYVIGPAFQSLGLTTPVLMEKIFSVLFHTATGAIMAYGVLSGKKVFFWIIAAIGHALSAYLIVLVQMQIIGLSTLATMLSFYYLAFYFYAGILKRQTVKRLATGKKKRR